MKILGILLAVGFAFDVGAAARTTLQCSGNNVRQQGTNFKAHSMFIMDLTQDEAAPGGVNLRRWIGHVQIHGYGDVGVEDDLVSYYSSFMADKKETIPATLSPRAKRYKDSEYFRFKKFTENGSSYHDGGGMNGTLVLSKEVLDKDNKSARAHYIFQSGDHMGGTLDLTCLHD